MNFRWAVCFLAAWAIASCLLYADTNSPGPRRIVHGTVLNIDGTPAAGRAVHLVGLSRGATRSASEDPTKPMKGWDFTTDAQGKFTATLGGFNAWEKDDPRPGWGTYVFYADSSAHDAGAISPHLLCYNPIPEYYKSESTQGWGPYQEVPAAGLDLTLHLKPGLTITGRVVEYPAGRHPIAGVPVLAYTDLFSESHTGYGGEILQHETQTAPDGTFTLPQVHPAKVYLKLGADLYEAGPVTWLKTKLPGGPWEDILDIINPPAKGQTLSLQIMAAKEPAFAYHGRITDPAGHPITGAQVTLGVSYHPEEQTFADSHTNEHTTTDKEGAYHFFLPTPWIRYINVTADHYMDGSKEIDNESTMLPPGKYDFTLHPQKAPEAKSNPTPPQ